MTGRCLRTRVIVMVCTAAVCVPAVGAHGTDAASSTPMEYQVKAAFLYRFINFIDWPGETHPEGEDSVVIGNIGTGPMRVALQSIAESQGHPRRLIIKHFKDPEDLGFCHVLFIGGSEKRRIGEILKKVRGTSTLTVSEIEGFADRGGMINFVIIGDMVRFEINVGAVRAAKLKISSKLLRLARVVEGKR